MPGFWPFWPILASALALLALFDLPRHPILTLLALALGFVALAPAVRRLDRGATRVGVPILAGSLLLRLPLVALPPSLSDDVWRYLWDGRVVAARLDPYSLAPADPRTAGLRDDLWQRVAHRDVPSVYPPLAMAAFSIASRLPAPLLAWKLLATAADLATVALLLAIARRAAIAEARVAWYAWNPLVALEVAGMGHVDALAIPAVAAAVLALLPGRAPVHEVAGRRGGGPISRSAAAAIAAAVGILGKLGPIAALPMWARQSRRPVVFLAVATGLSAVALAPVVASVSGVPPGLATYGLHWEWNGPLYEPLWRLLERIDAAGAIKRALDFVKGWTGDHASWNRLYPFVYPRLLAKALLAVGAVAAIAASLRERDPIRGTGRLFGRLLLVAATVYPWYLLWVLPWAALAEDRRWLVVGAVAPLSYLPAMLGVALWPWLFVAIWGPFALLSLAPRLRWPSS